MTAAEGAAMVDPDLNWDDIERFAAESPLPVIVKGVLTPEDARRAAAHGAQAIIVSNHGGRQLDTVISGADALAPVVDEVGGAVDVLVDGGIRRGTDVLKALALGAQFVFVGRPLLFAAVVAGEPGVQRALTLLKDEVDRDMALLGVRSLAEVTPDLVRRLGPEPPFGRNTP